MIEVDISPKLEGLHTELEGVLRNAHHQNFGGKRIVSLFERFESLRSQLAQINPNLFADFPPIDVPKGGEEGQLPIHRPQIEELLAGIESIRSTIHAMPTSEAEAPIITREGVFFAGQTYDAFRKVQSIVETATGSIWLIDNYLDPFVLDLFTTKSSSVTIYILTRELSSVAMLAAQKFRQQYTNLQIRSTDRFHDRFLTIDDRDYYHFGASIKDVGRRGFMFSRIEEQSIIVALRAEISSAWNTAKIEL